MKILSVDDLEREGGHIVVLCMVGVIALMMMCCVTKPAVESVCHDVAIGSFSALLALLKGNGKHKPESKPNETTS